MPKKNKITGTETMVEVAADNTADNTTADMTADTTAGMGAPSRGFPVVGIGASAGGLRAFQEFLGGMPADGGIAFVLVSHLEPSRESQLPAILARSTSMLGRSAKAMMLASSRRWLFK